jgi:hypothetical protein
MPVYSALPPKYFDHIPPGSRNRSCFRLYEILATNEPEILRSNFTSIVLSLKATCMDDLLSFNFMDPPQMETLILAMKDLHALSAELADQRNLLNSLLKNSFFGFFYGINLKKIDPYNVK